MNSPVGKIEHFEKFGSILGLERIGILLERMGNPQRNLKCIHIAGTNGKGSTSRFVYEVLREQGYKVGIYSSPFLEVFNERIEVDGNYISDEDLERVLEETTRIGMEIEKEDLPVPTEFDIVTASAFRYFDEEKVDFVVLEVGLGGRADSTNIIEKPLVSAITSISFDHTDRLGNTIREIAVEKAGIIKEKVPVIIGRLPDEAYKVVREISKEKKANLVCSYSDEYIHGQRKVCIESSNIFGSRFTVDDKKYIISMIGNHQIDNAVTALGILEKIEELGYTINDSSYEKGFDKAFNKGRMELLKKDEKIFLLDGAHNEAGMKAFVDTMIDNFSKEDKKILIVLGVLEDKDLKGICKHLVRLKEYLDFELAITEPNNTRKLDLNLLDNRLIEYGLKTILKVQLDDIIEAISDRDYNLVAFVGSLYLIGDVRGRLLGRKI